VCANALVWADYRASTAGGRPREFPWFFGDFGSDECLHAKGGLDEGNGGNAGNAGIGADQVGANSTLITSNRTPGSGGKKDMVHPEGVNEATARTGRDSRIQMMQRTRGGENHEIR
jgi:hypothetical protein